MSKKEVKKVIASTEKKAPEQPVKKGEVPTEQSLPLETPVDNSGSEKPSATQPIPPIVDEPHNHPDVEKTGKDLSFENFDDKRSVKFKIDPDTIKAPSYSTDDFRGFYNEYIEKKGAKPNNLFINTESLERLGWRDVATDLGLHIKETTGYKKTEMVLALDL